MTLNFEWFNPQRGRQLGANGRGVPTGVRVSHSEYKNARGGVTKYTQIRLGPDIMKHCRFLVGDKVLFGMASGESGKFIAIRRDPNGKGYTLSNSKGEKAKGSANEYGVLKMSLRDILKVDVPLAHCNITSDGTLLIPLNEKYVYE